LPSFEPLTRIVFLPTPPQELLPGAAAGRLAFPGERDLGVLVAGRRCGFTAAAGVE